MLAIALARGRQLAEQARGIEAADRALDASLLQCLDHGGGGGGGILAARPLDRDQPA